MWRILIVIGIFGAIPRFAAAVASCLEYEIVTLSGTLVRQTYPGPPDYEDVAKGDEPQVIWILLLDRGICVVDADPRYPREYNEREVQLVLEPEHYAKYKNLLGERVRATGQLLHGGARYHKRLVLTAREIERTRVVP